MYTLVIVPNILTTASAVACVPPMISGAVKLTLAVAPVYPAPSCVISNPVTELYLLSFATAVLYVCGKYVLDTNPFLPKSITEFDIFAKPPFATLKP